MPTVLQLRRGTTAQNDAFTGSAGELTFNTTTGALRAHDGTTAGGAEMLVNDGSNASISQSVTLTGAVTGSGTITNLGNLSITTTATSDPTITLAGDLTGSVTLTNLGNGTLTATVVDDSHNHIISNVDGLQTALDAKQAAATALTTSTSFGGDVSGTYNAIVVADDSHNHIISNVDGLQTALDAKQAAATALTTSTSFGGDVSGTYNAIVVADDSHNHIISNVDGLQTALDAKAALSGATFTGDVSGTNLTLSGNLTVNGTTTTVATTNTVVSDNLIELNNGAASNANDSGIVIERGSTGDNAFIGWDESADKFIVGTTTATGASTGDLVITAANLTVATPVASTDAATKGYVDSAVSTSPVITLAGDLSGSCTLTNLGSATLTATIAANSVALGTDTTGNYVAAGATSGNGISGSVSSEGGTFTVTSNATSANTASTIVYRDISGNFSAGTITGTATTAQYADLAENYMADEAYAAGTVVAFGGDAEVTVANTFASRNTAGVVSTNPAHLMNSELTGDTVVALALAGRVPCRVVGVVRKGDLMVASNTPGCAIAWGEELRDPPAGSIIGKALENKSGQGEGIIEVVVGVR